MITVAGQMFIELEKELDFSDKIIEGYEDYIGDNKIRNDILDKVCVDNVKEICSEKDEVYKTILLMDLLKFYIIINVKCYQTNIYCSKNYQ